MSDVPDQPTTSRSRPRAAQIGIVVGILALGLILTRFTSKVTQASEPGIRLVNDRPYLPEQAGEWRGGELQGLSEIEQKLLIDADGARRVYTDPAGRQLFCSVVLAGRDVTSIHRPELCLTGQGWQLASPHPDAIATPATPRGILKVTRMDAHRQVPISERQVGRADAVFVYWFAGKDRTTPHNWQRILWSTLDRLLHNRNHRWAYFLIFAPMPSTATATEYEAAKAQASKAIAQLVQSIYPELAVGKSDQSVRSGTR